MKISIGKNDKVRLKLTKAEARTFAIALANLSYDDFEKDVEENNLKAHEVHKNHVELFNQLSDGLSLFEVKEQ